MATMFFSAILNDLTSRSISFLIDKCLTKMAAPMLEETLNCLQRLLHRAHVIIEESQERIVTNQAMLQQLNRLQKVMYRGYHTLDTLRCRAPDQAVAARSRFNPAKRLRRGSSSSEYERATQVLGDLETAIRDVSEVAVFLSRCPRLCRQPYSVHLLVGKCMFNRQMEMERVMDFLLRGEDSSGAEEDPAVLPIIGPGKVGKTTIIEHACNDQRVRSYFSQILRFSQDDIRDVKTISTLGDCSVIKLHDRAVVRGEKMTTLVIIELTGDIHGDLWEKLYSDCRHQIGRGSKIIVASRSDKIARLGRATQTQPLRVQFFTEEAYWYLFKARTFGSTDMKNHPKVAAIAMDLAREMSGCFLGASVLVRLLKDNFDARIWSMVLAQTREFKRMNLLLFGVDFVDLWQVVDPVFVRQANNASSEYFVVFDGYQTVSVEEESAQSGDGPQMSIIDHGFGENVRPRGRFKVLAWRSHIPPHYSYMMTLRGAEAVFSRKKRIQHFPTDPLVAVASQSGK